MQVTVVYESLYGNTHQVATAIARGIADTRPDATIEVVPVTEAHPAHAGVADLLIVGGPTHMRGMSTGFSRHLTATAEAKKPPAEQHLLDGRADGPGLRDWITRLPSAGEEGHAAAAFDTRIGARFAGGAARGIGTRLRRLGYRLIDEPEGFLIQDDGTGPLKDGELVRAHAWGAELARRMTPVAVA
jgi:hypothetical protein